MLEPVESSIKNQNFIKINVNSRIEQYASYVTYEIKIETNDPSFSFQESSINRRYSDFRTLHSMLTKQFPFIKPPSLPPKAPFKGSFDLEFVEKRRKGLEDFLAKMLSKKIYLSSRAFHLFLQTNHTIAEIKSMVEGKLPNPDLTKDTIFQTSISSLNEERLTRNSSAAEDATCSGELDAASDSIAGSKRVSFCDQVTVAEVYRS